MTSVPLKLELCALRKSADPEDIVQQRIARRLQAETEAAEYLFGLVKSALLAIAKDPDPTVSAVLLQTNVLRNRQVREIFGRLVRENELQYKQLYPRNSPKIRGEPYLGFTSVHEPESLRVLCPEGDREYFTVGDLDDGTLSKQWLDCTSFRLAVNPLYTIGGF